MFNQQMHVLKTGVKMTTNPVGRFLMEHKDEIKEVGKTVLILVAVSLVTDGLKNVASNMLTTEEYDVEEMTAEEAALEITED